MMKKNINTKIYSIYGINNSKELLKSDKVNATSIYIMENGQAFKNKKINHFIRSVKDKCKILNKYEFNKNFPNIRSQGIIINFRFKFNNSIPNFKDNNVCLLLPEGIEDPQNLGQIIRTSECAGINGVLVSEKRSVGITNTVLQVSQGAFLNMPIYTIGNINQTLSMLKKEGFWIIGVENSIDSSNWYDIDFLGKVVIVVGSEGKGIRKSTLKNCDYTATIPMMGNINSLNVSAAVSAILFERNRQIIIKSEFK